MKIITRLIPDHGRYGVCVNAIRVDIVDPVRYFVSDNDFNDHWFRYDNGWRYLGNKPDTTIDLEVLMTDELWQENFPKEIPEMLEELRCS